MAKEYVNELLSKESQSKLIDIGMISEIVNIPYDNVHLNDLQKNKSYQTISVFNTTATLKNCQDLSKLAIFGDKTSLNKLKKMLV